MAESAIAGYTPPAFRFGGLGASPLVARADIVTTSLAGLGVATTAARSDIVSASLAGPGVATTIPHSDVLTAILTAKGAILLGGASSTVGALTVGSNTQALVADSTQTLGAKWAGDTAWVNVGTGGGAPAFLNSWTNLGGAFAVVSYRKDALGFVHLRGIATAGTGGTNVFNLPAGFRPALSEIFSVAQTDAAQTVNQFGRLTVAGSGDVSSTTTATGAWVSLSGVTFLAEA